MSKKTKSVAWDDVRADLMSDPDVQAAMEVEERKARLQAMLAQWRKHAGLTRAQVAERMGLRRQQSPGWKRILSRPVWKRLSVTPEPAELNIRKSSCDGHLMSLWRHQVSKTINDTSCDMRCGWF